MIARLGPILVLALGCTEDVSLGVSRDAAAAGRDAAGRPDARVVADAAGRHDGPAPALADAPPGRDARPAADAAARPDAAAPDAFVPADASGADAATELWRAGAAPTRAPAPGDVLDLPGGGAGPPVFTSNNPEIFTGAGFLYEVARASATRGGETYPLSGRFGVYLHHVNRAGRPLSLVLLVTNPGAASVTVGAHGSGYNQTETGGLGLGFGPDYQVAADWLTGTAQTTVAPTALASQRPLAVWTKSVANNAEVDGRFEIDASGPVYVYLVATETGDLNEAVTLSRTDAPGDIRAPGTPPPPFGREAGVYAHDRWTASFAADVPVAPAYLAYGVNTATGSGHRQVQAFPALSRFSDSSAEAVGMYGNVYDLTVTLRHDGGAGSRTARVLLAGDVPASSPLSFQWNGPGRVDGALVPVLLTPAGPLQELARVTLTAGQSRAVHVELPVPGLTSIAQALIVESLP